jgi:hypothetical protein
MDPTHAPHPPSPPSLLPTWGGTRDWQGALSGRGAPLAAMVGGTRPLASPPPLRPRGKEDEGGPSFSKASPAPSLGRAAKFWG